MHHGAECNWSSILWLGKSWSSVERLVKSSTGFSGSPAGVTGSRSIQVSRCVLTVRQVHFMCVWDIFLTKVFLGRRVVHVKQHLLGQALQLVLRVGHGSAALRGTQFRFTVMNKQVANSQQSFPPAHITCDHCCLLKGSKIKERPRIKIRPGSTGGPRKNKTPDFNKSGRSGLSRSNKTHWQKFKCSGWSSLCRPPSEVSDPGSGPRGARPRRLCISFCEIQACGEEEKRITVTLTNPCIWEK